MINTPVDSPYYDRSVKAHEKMLETVRSHIPTLEEAEDQSLMISEIAPLLGVTPQTIGRWVRNYEEFRSVVERKLRPKIKKAETVKNPHERLKKEYKDSGVVEYKGYMYPYYKYKEFVVEMDTGLKLVGINRVALPKLQFLGS